MKVYYYTIKTDEGIKAVKGASLKSVLEQLKAKKVYSTKRTSALAS